MRDLKFRGLDINGRWWYGELNPQGENHINLATFFSNVHIGIIRSETIGQYTGLKDKNGKEIYEGDIWAWQNPWDKEPKIRGIKNVVEYKTGDLNIAGYNLGGVSIIGNVYEHPELLEERSKNGS